MKRVKPADSSTGAFARAVTSKVGEKPTPVLVVVRRECGCVLGRVLRGEPGGLLLVGRARVVGYVGEDELVSEHHPFMHPLAGEPAPRAWNCKHAEGFFPVPELTAAAKAATRRGERFLV